MKIPSTLVSWDCEVNLNPYYQGLLDKVDPSLIQRGIAMKVSFSFLRTQVFEFQGMVYLPCCTKQNRNDGNQQEY